MKCCICGRDLTGQPAMVDRATGEAFCERDAHYFGQHPSNRPQRHDPDVPTNKSEPPAEYQSRPLTDKDPAKKEINMVLSDPPDVEIMKATRDGKGLIEALEYKKDHRVRAAAAGALAEVGNEQSAEPLIRALEDENEYVQIWAVYAIGCLKDMRAVTPLIKKLGNGNKEMQIRVVSALGKIGGPAVEPLIVAIQDRNKGTREREAAAEVLIKIDTPAMERTIAILTMRDKYLRQQVLEVLDKTNPSISRTIRAALQQSDLKRDSECYYGLSIVNGNEIKYSGPLIKMEQSGDDIPNWVQQVFHNKPSSHFLILPQMGMLIIILSASDFQGMQFASPMSKEVSEKFLSSMMSSKTARMVEQFGAIELQGDKTPDTISRDATPPTKASTSPKNKVYEDVVNLIHGLPSKPDDERQRVIGALRRMLAAGVYALIDALKDSEANVRESAAFALGEIGDAAGVMPLIKVTLNDTNEDVRSMASKALEKMGCFGSPDIEKMKTERDVDGLIRELGYQKNSYLRLIIANVLGDIGDARAVEPLLTSLKDAKLGLRNSIIEALGKIGDARAVEPLKSALNDSNEIARKAAAEALRKIGGPGVKEPPAQIQKGASTPPASESRPSPVEQKTTQTQSMSTPSDYSRYTKAVIYCRQGFNVSTLRLPGFTGNAEVIRSGSFVEKAEIVAAMLMKGCDEDCILVSPPDYGVGFIK